VNGSGAKLAWLASPCGLVDVVAVVPDRGIDASKKIVSAMTLQQVRECFSGVLVDARLQVCDQDTYVCYRCTRWLTRTQEAIEQRRNKRK